jgi:hypothetical protein
MERNFILRKTCTALNGLLADIEWADAHPKWNDIEDRRVADLMREMGRSQSKIRKRFGYIPLTLRGKTARRLRIERRCIRVIAKAIRSPVPWNGGTPKWWEWRFFF